MAPSATSPLTLGSDNVLNTPCSRQAEAKNAEDHADVNMATGLLIVNQACTAEQAEGLLRQAAQHDAQTILQIAQRIIQQHQTSR